MKSFLFVLLIMSQAAFAQKLKDKQKGYRRSDGDLLTGTWKCVKCKDTTVQAINFQDTMFTTTRVSPDGVKSDTCAYKVKRNKVFIRCAQGDKKKKYRIVLIDINSLELKQWNKKSEEFKKSQ